jgi:hypothetical protein
MPSSRRSSQASNGNRSGMFTGVFLLTSDVEGRDLKDMLIDIEINRDCFNRWWKITTKTLLMTQRHNSSRNGVMSSFPHTILPFVA